MGAVYEGGRVWWVAFAARDHAGRAAIVSVLLAASLVFGLGAAVRDPVCAPGWIAGYGVGTYIGILLKRHLWGFRP